MICDGKEREQTGKLIEKDMCGTLTRSEYTEFFWCWWWVVLIIMWSLPDCIEVRMGCDQNIFDQMILTSLQMKLVSRKIINHLNICVPRSTNRINTKPNSKVHLSGLGLPDHGKRLYSHMDMENG